MTVFSYALISLCGVLLVFLFIEEFNDRFAIKKETKR